MTQIQKTYDSLEIKKLDKSRIEISASIPTEMWGKYRTQALKNINDTVKLDGFRKGNIPENVLVSKVGEMAILEEMAELAIGKAYVDIVIDKAIDAISRPKVELTKIAQDNPLEFKATAAVVPEIVLPDYKKIASTLVKEKTAPEEVSEKDIEDALVKIRKSRVSHEGHDHDSLTPEEHDKMLEKNMPEVTDDFVKSLGAFTDVADFKAKLKVMLTHEKVDAAREKLRIRISDALADATTFELPDIMIDAELKRMQIQFESDIERMGVKLPDYLKHAKKTIEEVHTEWRPHAEKKAKLQLILNEIALTEKIAPDQKEIDVEVGHIVEHYAEADRERAAVYAETVLTNEKVFLFLENVK